MKKARTIIWIIIAILPIIFAISKVIGNIGNTTGIENIPMGTAAIVPTSDGKAYYVETQENTWGRYLLQPFFGNGKITGFYGAILGMVHNISTNAGIPISVPLMMSIILLVHLSLIELFDSVISLIMFVPRKCKELFGG